MSWLRHVRRPAAVARPLDPLDDVPHRGRVAVRYLREEEVERQVHLVAAAIERGQLVGRADVRFADQERVRPPAIDEAAQAAQRVVELG